MIVFQIIGWLCAWLLLWAFLAEDAWNRKPRPNEDVMACIIVSGVLTLLTIGFFIGVVYGIKW